MTVSSKVPARGIATELARHSLRRAAPWSSRLLAAHSHRSRQAARDGIIVPAPSPIMHNHAKPIARIHLRQLPRAERAQAAHSPFAWQGPTAMLDRTSRIVVAGAGSIGCYLGGCLARAGRRVTLLLRPILADDIALHGLGISDFAGLEAVLPASAFELSSEPQFALAAAQVLLVTVKSGATGEMAGHIAQYAPPHAIAVSFQNGVGNMETLAAHLGAARTIVAGMVPFNVVQVRNQGQAPHF